MPFSAPTARSDFLSIWPNAKVVLHRENWSFCFNSKKKRSGTPIGVPLLFFFLVLINFNYITFYSTAAASMVL